jgi:hypothetical protein
MIAMKKISLKYIIKRDIEDLESHIEHFEIENKQFFIKYVENKVSRDEIVLKKYN